MASRGGATNTVKDSMAQRLRQTTHQLGVLDALLLVQPCCLCLGAEQPGVGPVQVRRDFIYLLLLLLGQLLLPICLQ